MTDFTSKIIELIDETHDVRTFRLKRPDALDFISGQFTLVSFVDSKDFEGVSKPFTLASPPTEKNYVDFTIKKLGNFTQALFSLKIGEELGFVAPNGEALNFDDSVKDDIVFIAGGSGITPFISAIRYAVAKKMNNKILLLFSNKTVSDIIYKKELEKIEGNNENITVVNTITNEEPPDETFEKGRVTEEMIKKYCGNLQTKSFYVCGPPAMVTGTNEILAKIGVSSGKIRFEQWMLPGKG
ncbi:hypothetical protein GOV08_00480 [Candidatus Woesearchaeota archaeon]|nr:hypothetical protein [Candidatus Woesearchaeota archaeon]